LARRPRRSGALPHARYGVNLAKVPDTYIEPFVAYRAWNWTAEGVTSLSGALWTPKVAFEAKCHYSADLCSMRAATNGSVAAEFWKSKSHQVPGPGCTCGIYAGINMQHLIDINYIERGIHGEVSLWGRLYRHTLGWRARFAYPKFFVVPLDMVPFHLDEAQERLAKLVEFDVDIYLQPEREVRVGRERIPLWIRDYGYSQQGVSFLIERRQKVVFRREGEAHARGRRPPRGLQRRERRRHSRGKENRGRRDVLHDVQPKRDLPQEGQGRRVERAELAVGDERSRLPAPTRRADGTLT
jgi:hypothetical protein